MQQPSVGASNGLLLLLLLLSHSACSLAFQPSALLSAGVRTRSASRMPLRFSMMEFSVDAEIAKKQAEQNVVWEALTSKMAARAAAQAEKRQQDGTMLFFANMFNGGVSEEDQAVQQEMARMGMLIADLQKLQAQRGEERAAAVVAAAKLKDTKAKLLKLCSSVPKNGVGAPSSAQLDILALATALAEGNPTSEQATTPLLDGRWALVYTSNEGSSAGKLGPFVGHVTQEIELSAKEYVNKVDLGGIIGAELGATWEVEGEARWAVTFHYVAFLVFGGEVYRKELSGGRGSRDATLDTLDKLSNVGSLNPNPQPASLNSQPASVNSDSASLNSGSAPAYSLSLSLAYEEEEEEADYEGSAANGGYWDMAYTDDDLRVLFTSGIGADPSKRSLFVLSRA